MWIDWVRLFNHHLHVIELFLIRSGKGSPVEKRIS